MREKPIIFSGPMVCAILDGTKTQTRRVLKPQPRQTDAGEWYLATAAGFQCLSDPHLLLRAAPGDRLWVRETWRIGSWDHERGQMCVDFQAGDCADPQWRDVPDPDWFEDQWIKISNRLIRSGMKPDIDGHYTWKRGEAPLPWRPSIHMPRWASRISLLVTAVRVQRLQDISRGDCMSEGCPFANMADGPDPRSWFRELWDTINAKRPGCSWQANPWVMAVTFETTADPRPGVSP